MQVVYTMVARNSVVALLREHLRRNIVRIGKQWHYQSSGIPQVCCESASRLLSVLLHVSRSAPQCSRTSSCANTVA